MSFDLSGQRFGRLVAQDFIVRRNLRMWRCVCDCGSETRVSTGELRAMKVGSCGCAKREALALGARRTTHGLSHSRTYTSWLSMKKRCLNPNAQGYARWGGRGIKIDPRWMQFENFLADMGERPAGMTLDRWPNNDGDYELANCRWATPTQQAANRRKA